MRHFNSFIGGITIEYSATGDLGVPLTYSMV